MNNRRQFLKTLASLGFLSFTNKAFTLNNIVQQNSLEFEIKTLTSGPKHHFFGYYGICPWNESEKYVLSLESSFQDHMPSRHESANIGLVDSKTGKFEKITQTMAWNFQQGAMLHWNPKHPENEIIFNDRRENQIVSTIFDINTGKERILPRPINGISHNGKYALSLSYGRLGRLRKVVGYEAVIDPYPDEPHPENDGVFLMDLETGKTNLVVSIDRVYNLLVSNHPDLPELRERHLWFNHVVFNKDDTRFFFLVRTRTPKGSLETGMCTVNIDGSNLIEAIPYGSSVSHFDWRNHQEIVATFRWKDFAGRAHYLFTDGQRNFQKLGDGFLDSDGHCSFGPNSNWLVSDPATNLLQNARSLKLYNVETKEKFVLGIFPLGKYRSGDLRCDLHPRWNRSGNAICFDGIEQKSATRQLHVVSLQGI
jgi:hypothetical protein